MGAGALAAALALGATPPGALAAAAAGAALAAAVRALAGESAAALTAAVIAPLLAVASIAERGGSLAAPCLALAGIGWTIWELARPSARPTVALLPAALAALLAPAASPLLAIAGARVAAAPRGPARPAHPAHPALPPRWTLAIPLAGAAVVALAIVTGAASPGRFAELWFGATARPIAPSALAALAAAALGPIAALAALGGILALARPRPRPARDRQPELAAAACIAGALLADLRAGAIGPLTLGLGALAAALGAARFAGQIRLPAGQALTGAVVGLMLLLPSTLTLTSR
jgi:hypothetical protein